MLLAEKLKKMSSDLSELYYNYGDMWVNYYLKHYNLLNTLAKEVDKCYLEFKETDTCCKLCLLNSNILIAIPIDNKNILYYYYGIKKLVINFQYLNTSLDNKKISDEFVGEDILSYKIVSLEASTKIFKYIDENFSNLMSIDINIIELDTDINKIIFIPENRIYYNIEPSKLNDLSILTNCVYKQLVSNKFHSICSCHYIKTIKSMKELNLNDILEYLSDKKRIFVTNAYIFIILRITYFDVNKGEDIEKMRSLANKNIQFINMFSETSFEYIEYKFHFKINLGEKKCI